MEAKFLLLIVFAGAMEAVADKEHVHFKIHVPEIIKHHMHTHTIFIHVHHPSKKKKTSHLHNEHEDWNIYKTYSQPTGYGGEYEEGGEDEDVNKDRVTQYPSLVTYRGHSETTVPYYDDFTGNPQYAGNPEVSENEYETGIAGYAYPPFYTSSHYQVTEAVDEAPGSQERTNYEQSRKSGGEIAQGHVHEKESQSFYKNKIEESSEKTTKTGGEESFGFPGLNYIKKQLG